MAVGDVQLSPEELDAQLAAAGAPASTAPPPVELAAALPGAAPADLPVAATGNPPPAPALSMAPPVVAPAPAGMHVAKGSRAVEHTEANPNLPAGLEAGMAAIDQKAAAAKQQEPIDQEKARIEGERADAAANETARQNMLAQAEEQARQDKIQAVNTDIDTIQRRIEANKAKAPAGFEGWSGLEVALGAVSVLGALVAKNGGGIGPAANAALGLIDRHVAKEFNAKKAALEEDYKALAERHGYSTELENQAKDAFAHLTAQRLQALDYISKHYDAQQKALGPAGATVAAAEVQAKFAAEKAAQQANLGKILSSKVTDTMQVVPGHAGGGGAPSNALSQLSAFARVNRGPEKEAIVIAEAERLFPALRGKPAQLQQLVTNVRKTSEDAAAARKGSAQAIGELEADLSATSDLAALIDKHPEKFKAVQEAIISYRQLEKHPPPGRALGQYLGVARKSAEENLKDDTERDMFGRLMQQETRTAKNYGGVITESDIARAQSEQALTGATPKQFAANLRKNAKSLGIKLSELTGGAPDQAAERATNVASGSGTAFSKKPDPIKTARDALAAKAGL